MPEQERPYRMPKGSPLPYQSTPTPTYPPQQYPPQQYPPQQYPPTQYPPEQQYPPQQYPPTQYPPTQYPPTQYPQPKYPPEAPYYPTDYANDNMDLPKGDITGYYVAYTRDYDRDPNRVLERKLPWYVCCEWAVIGTAVAAFSGTWHLRAFAESIGPNQDKTKDSEVELFHVHVDVDSVEPSKKREYMLEVAVPPTAIPQDGAYKVVILLTHSITGKKSGKEHVTRLAGFVEIPMLQFYTYEE